MYTACQNQIKNFLEAAKIPEDQRPRALETPQNQHFELDNSCFQLLQRTLDIATEPWGVKVERVEVILNLFFFDTYAYSRRNAN